MRIVIPILFLTLVQFVHGQEVSVTSGPQFMLTEEIGLPMNKAQLTAAVKQAWDVSFGQTPAARVIRMDPEDGVVDGQARLNFRSAMLAGREESMGVVSYSISIHIRNGHCTLHIHDVRHTGNKGAAGGGLDVGLLREGEAPVQHYPGTSLKFSRRLHAEVRSVAEGRIRELMRKFCASLRAQAGL